MQLFILITGIAELLVGLVLFVSPKLVPQFAKSAPLTRATARMYGAAAITIGVFAAMVGFNFDQTAWHQLFLIVFLVFHSLVALSVFIAIQLGEPADSKIAVLHVLLALGTAWFLF